MLKYILSCNPITKYNNTSSIINNEPRFFANDFFIKNANNADKIQFDLRSIIPKILKNDDVIDDITVGDCPSIT